MRSTPRGYKRLERKSGAQARQSYFQFSLEREKVVKLACAWCGSGAHRPRSGISKSRAAVLGKGETRFVLRSGLRLRAKDVGGRCAGPASASQARHFIPVRFMELRKKKADSRSLASRVLVDCLSTQRRVNKLFSSESLKAEFWRRKKRDSFNT